jgi:hypothetical protein
MTDKSQWSMVNGEGQRVSQFFLQVLKPRMPGSITKRIDLNHAQEL